MNEFFATHLATISQMLALFSTEEIAGHVESCEASLSMHDSLGCMLDPTAWMQSADSGRTEDARLQLEIVRHLLAARKAIDKREAFVAGKRVPA